MLANHRQHEASLEESPNEQAVLTVNDFSVLVSWYDFLAFPEPKCLKLWSRDPRTPPTYIMHVSRKWGLVKGTIPYLLHLFLPLLNNNDDHFVTVC